MVMQGYYDVFKWFLLRRTSPEVKCLHPRHEMCTKSVSDVNYHKFHTAQLSMRTMGKTLTNVRIIVY